MLHLHPEHLCEKKEKKVPESGERCCLKEKGSRPGAGVAEIERALSSHLGLAEREALREDTVRGEVEKLFEGRREGEQRVENTKTLLLPPESLARRFVARKGNLPVHDSPVC